MDTDNWHRYRNRSQGCHRDVLIGIIVRQQVIIDGLEQRIAQLEGQAKPSVSRRMPGLKPKADWKPAWPKGPGQARRHRFA